jgi:DNA-binding transcriptional LysR family regulator
MDTELARTFLTVVAAGSFIDAADRLHVTQSTVSSRIRALENALGCTLFVRNKAGTTMTPAGRQFQKHALTLVRTLEQARHDIGVPAGFRATLTIGGRLGLWERLLLDWLSMMRRVAPDIALRAEIGFEKDLMQGLVDGRLDIGVMYTPESRPGLVVERLFEERLVLVTTSGGMRAGPRPNYVYVDWGPEFYAKHASIFPDGNASALSVNIGWLGLQHVLQSGGSGYFPIRVVRPFLADGRLTISGDAPEFTLPAYAVYPANADPGVVGVALDAVRQASRARGGAATKRRRTA